MNYRHLYHAGNFADVFKHAVLTLLLQALNAKDKPCCYVETHAGAGRYDMESELKGSEPNGTNLSETCYQPTG